jgi:hypothetical protein
MNYLILFNKGTDGIVHLKYKIKECFLLKTKE